MLRFTLVLTALCVALPAAAQVRLPLEGSLTESGAAVAGPVDLDVRVLASDDSVVSCEEFRGVALTDGVFNILIGDSTNDCGGGEPTEIPADAFFDITSLRVTYEGEDFDYPIGDSPSAGVATFCEAAQSLEGFFAADFLGDPRSLRIPVGGDLDLDVAAAIAALPTAPSDAAPVSIVLDAGIYTSASDVMTLPSFVSLRGASQTATQIRDLHISMSTGGEVSDLNFVTVSQGDVLTLTGGEIRVHDVTIRAQGNAAGQTGVRIEGTGDRIEISDCYIDVQSDNPTSMNIEADGFVTVRSSTIRTIPNAGTANAVTILDPTAPIGRTRIVFDNVDFVFESFPVGAFFITHPSPVLLKGITVFSGGTRPDIEVAGGNAVVRDSQLSNQSTPSLILTAGTLFVINSQLNTRPAPGIVGLTCINSTDLVGSPLGGDCG